MSDVVRFRVTTSFEYEIPLEHAEAAYGTDDPTEMARIDEEQMNQDGNAIFIAMESAVFNEIKVEPIL